MRSLLNLDALSIGAIEHRMISGMRLLLAASALVIIYVDPSEPDRYVRITYTLLSLYTIYSGLLYIFSFICGQHLSWLRQWAHWLDIAWYIGFVAVSSGTNSIFFMLLLFPILVASFRFGFLPGIGAAAAASVLFTIVGYWSTPPPMELNRFLLRPISLLSLGYIVARRGEFEIMLQHRLALLKDISTMSNPRFGVSRTLGINMERLRSFYDADACLFIFEDNEHGTCSLRRATPSDPDQAYRSEDIARDLAYRLLEPGPDRAVLFTFGPRWFGVLGRRYTEIRLSGPETGWSGKSAEATAVCLETRSYVSIPVRFGESKGRIYLTSRYKAFRLSDVAFLIQVIQGVAPVIENVRLVDKLASSAAEEEHRRLALDIHDSIIQPYIGVQIGLSAIGKLLDRVRQEPSGDAEAIRSKLSEVGDGIHAVIEMTGAGIRDLRQVVSSLRQGGPVEGNLIPAVERYAAKFADATGIAAKVEVKGDFQISDRVAAEVFRMVEEGLSNIRRHTRSPSATVRLFCKENALVLRIENEVDGGAEPPSFMPRSIAERAEAMQGNVCVGCQYGICSVVVAVPL